ncbi:hypothetical protein AJ80_07568 [Polytolypa hystricis UAMH7299]|uniref:Uncharacterized protein n=1 Tax=Polytolypa hystricis (strain UAMH7299) TaxID=1447883 RepID=A0A2B7XND8_POLH7|nr:hypothetical protein AJ80_07568 [Polytolypa hystricis UAMH7299]
MAQTRRTDPMSKNHLGGQEYPYKEVRFSPTSSPIRRSKSLHADSARLSAPRSYHGPSQLENQPIFQFSAYAEQARQALRSQRLSFERERIAFEDERKLWDGERAMMMGSIADLERELAGRASGGRSRTVPPPGAGQPSGRPVNGHHIWEGSSPTSKPTRIFPEDHQGKQTDKEDNCIGSIPSLDEALSPRPHPVDRSPPVGVPIEFLDSSLDGITLKSTALPPDVAARVSSSSPSAITSPTSQPLPKPKPDRRISASELRSPDKNLIRDAGHTPLPIIEAEADTAIHSPSTGTLKEEEPLAPRQTIQSNGPEDQKPHYHKPEEDPALTGPLSLQNNHQHDRAFLDELDQKLLDEAKRVVTNPPLSEDGGSSDNEENQHGEPEPELEIKFKHSTNFGSAFGSSQ